MLLELILSTAFAKPYDPSPVVPGSDGTVQNMTMPASFNSSASAATMTTAMPVPTQGGISIYYLTSRTTQPMSYQNMKGAGGGSDSGSDSGSVSLPNLNYLSAQAFTPVTTRGSLGLIGMQSLDSPDQLKVSTPFGSDFQLPSQVAMVRYRYQLSDAWSADLRGIYIDTVGYRDPSVGAMYTRNGTWMQSYGLSASAPVTASSQDDRLLTRTMLRSMLTTRVRGWAFATSFAHIHSFYQGGQPGARPARAKQSSTDDGKPVVPIYPSDVDLILIEREIHRTRGDLSLAYALSDRLSIGSGLGLSYSVTEKEHQIWMTTAKPLIAKYTVGDADIGLDVSLNSDIRDYNQPRMPSIMTIGLRAGYTWGQRPVMN